VYDGCFMAIVLCDHAIILPKLKADSRVVCVILDHL